MAESERGRDLAGGDMDPEVLRAHAHRVVDWIADYLASVGNRPVLPRVAPGEIAGRLPDAPPDAPETMDAILADLDRVVLPGITHWNHPAFLAYFGITGSGPGIIGEAVTAALNVNAMLWRTSPSATELEETTLDWLGQMLGLPASLRGMITDSASTSTLLALAAARERTGLAVRQRGLAGRRDVPRLRIYASEQAHSSVHKAAIVLGLGDEGVRAVGVDRAFRLDPDALRRAVEEDVATGIRPVAVVATVGTTSTTSIDPLPAVADVCDAHDLWLHVDAAYGGMAAIVPELAHVLDGADRADSLVVNPHKWLFTPIDCSALFVTEPDALRRTFALVPAYLETPESGTATDYMDWGFQLGRRFRALKLWMVIRWFGRDGLAARIREHVRIAQEAAARIDASDHLERLAPVPLSTVCFRARPAGAATDEEHLSELNARVLDAVNATGRVYLSHTVVGGRYALRLAVGNLRTTAAHVHAALDLVEQQAAAVGDR